MKKETNKKARCDDKPIDNLAKKTSLVEKKQKKRYVISEFPDFWMAHKIDDLSSGFILYDKKSGNYNASLSEFKLYYAELAKGGYNKPEDCPVDKSYSPKGELLLLIGLRERYKKNNGEDKMMKYIWRMLAIKQLLREIEESTGKATSEKNLKTWMNIAKDDLKFEKHIGEWLVLKIQDDGAGDFLIRMGNWINKIEFIETFTIESKHKKFFKAVENAAKKAGGIPTQKDVKKFFDKEFPADYGSSDTKFRSSMKKLYFDWLPGGGRGKNAH
jgi:hypothetical protein